MPVELNLLVNRRQVREDSSKEDSDLIIELGESVIDYRTSLQIIDVFTVSSEMAGRPWAIAEASGLGQNYTAALFFFNDYPNPFSVNEGDIILVPTLSSLKSAIRDNNTKFREIGQVPINASRAAIESARKEKISKKDKARQALKRRLLPEEIIEVSGNQSTGTDPQPANNGTIVLGADVSRARCVNPNELNSVQTKTEQIRRAVKERITRNQSS